jgi:hypothetical protein
MREPPRANRDTEIWFYTQHRALWDWVAGLTLKEVCVILKNKGDLVADYAVKRAWPGWGERWGLRAMSFACEMAGTTRTRCSKCPLGVDFCRVEGSFYRDFVESLKKGDIELLKKAAIAIRDAWAVPERRRYNW